LAENDIGTSAILGALWRFERHEALVLYDCCIVEKHVHEVGPGVRVLVELERKRVRLSRKQTQGQPGLSSVESARH
jgi:hypothetical protein